MGEEKLVKKTKRKEEYHYIDENENIDIVIKELYKKGKKINKIVVYPFKPRNGKPKYPKIRKITFLGYKEIPQGFEKSWRRGYGVRDEFYPLLKRIEKLYDNVDEIVICKKSMVRGHKIYLNDIKLKSFYYEMKTLLKTEKKVRNNVIDSFLMKSLSKKHLPQITTDYYVPGMLKEAINLYKSSKNVKLTNEDEEALLGIVSELTPLLYLSNRKKILATRDTVDKIFIEDVLKKFKELLSTKGGANLEEKWQRFFEEYVWIFSQLFSVPIIFFKSKAYVGGKGFQFKGGKITDFLYQNELTKNLAIIEIKTHRTKLLKRKPYRGNDVFAMSEDLSGGIAQVLDQKNTLLQNFLNLRSESESEVKAYNPRGILIIGQIKSLTPEQKASFELIRSNSKDVEIITFDELYAKLNALRRIMTGEWSDAENGK